MEISINLDVDDWKYFQSYLEKDLLRSSKSWINNFFVSLVIWAIIAIALLSLLSNPSDIHWPTASAITMLFVILFTATIVNSLKLKKALAPSKEGTFVGQHTVLFNDEGIKTQGKGYTCTQEWNVVKKIEVTEQMILIYLDTANALVLPLKKLENPNELYQFIIEKYNKSLNLTGAENAPPS